MGLCWQFDRQRLDHQASRPLDPRHWLLGKAVASEPQAIHQPTRLCVQHAVLGQLQALSFSGSRQLSEGSKSFFKLALAAKQSVGPPAQFSGYGIWIMTMYFSVRAMVWTGEGYLSSIGFPSTAPQQLQDENLKDSVSGSVEMRRIRRRRTGAPGVRLKLTLGNAIIKEWATLWKQGQIRES